MKDKKIYKKYIKYKHEMFIENKNTIVFEDFKNVTTSIYKNFNLKRFVIPPDILTFLKTTFKKSDNKVVLIAEMYKKYKESGGKQGKNSVGKVAGVLFGKSFVKKIEGKCYRVYGCQYF